MYELLALVRDGGEEDDADGACRRAGRPRRPPSHHHLLVFWPKNEGLYMSYCQDRTFNLARSAKLSLTKHDQFVRAVERARSAAYIYIYFF